MLAQPGGEAGQPVAVDGRQAEQFLGGAVAVHAGRCDGEHHAEPEPVAEEVEAAGGHQAQRPARPQQRRQGPGVLAGPGRVGDARRAGQGTVAELAEGVQPGRERLGQRGLQGRAGLVPAGEHVRRACCLLAAGLVVSEPGGDQRVGIAAPAVQHDVGDGGAGAGERVDARVLPGPAGDARLRAEFVQDRDGYGRGSGRPVQG